MTQTTPSPDPPLEGPDLPLQGSPSQGRRGRVSLFATCLADRYFAEACADTVHVLRHFGVEVEVPPGQTCCGQPAHNAGHRPEALRMARHTVATFDGVDPVVLPSGSCAAMLRRVYPRILDRATTDARAHAGPTRGPDAGSDDDSSTAAAGSLPDRTWELSEFLVRGLRVLEGPEARSEAGDEPRLGTGLAGLRVAYHHGCHALRELGVRNEPAALLRACGAEVVAWEADRECCGFGGLFSTKFPAVSAGMADRKLDTLPSGVDVVTSADGGCLLQLSGRAERRGGRTSGPGATFVHLATLLRRGIAS